MMYTYITALLCAAFMFFFCIQVKKFYKQKLADERKYAWYLIRKNKNKVLEFEIENKKRQAEYMEHQEPIKTPAGVVISDKELRKIPGTNEYRPHGVYDRDQLIEAIYVLTRLDYDDSDSEPPSDLRAMIATEVGDNRR